MMVGLHADLEYSASVYALIILFAVFCAFVVSRFTQNQLPLSTIQKLKLGLGGFVGAMLGAKIPFLFNDWNNLMTGAVWFSSGKTILTGLAGGYLGVELTKRSLDIKTGTGDSFVVPVAIAIGIGRFGCFYAGCCYGVPTSLPWGVEFEAVDSQLRHPTQIYESFFHLGFAAVAIWMASKNYCVGNRFKLYMVCYATFRFFSEMLRPEERWLGGLTAYQLASLILIAIFVWLWIREDQQRARSKTTDMSTESTIV